MAKLAIKKPDSATFRGWTFVLVAGVVLAVLAVIDRGGFATAARTSADPTGCQLTVATDELNIRSAPSAQAGLVDTLARGVIVDGTRTVTDGFRELADGRWAAEQYLTPLPGSTCT